MPFFSLHGAVEESCDYFRIVGGLFGGKEGVGVGDPCVGGSFFKFLYLPFSWVIDVGRVIEGTKKRIKETLIDSVNGY